MYNKEYRENDSCLYEPIPDWIAKMTPKERKEKINEILKEEGKI